MLRHVAHVLLGLFALGDVTDKSVPTGGSIGQPFRLCRSFQPAHPLFRHQGPEFLLPGAQVTGRVDDRRHNVPVILRVNTCEEGLDIAAGLLRGDLDEVHQTADAQLEEVIVTAQKRTESMQEVPIAISAFTE